MAEETKPEEPAQPSMQQKPTEQSPKPPEPPNIIFKGNEEPHETAVQKIEYTERKKG